MTITTIYLVSVSIDEDVYRRHGETPEYDRAVSAATLGALTSGQNAYAEVEEWAEFHDREQAEECERRLLAVARGELPS